LVVSIAVFIVMAIAAVVVAIPFVILAVVFAMFGDVGVLLAAITGFLGVVAIVLTVLLVRVPVASYFKYYALLLLGDTNAELDLIPDQRAAIRADGGDVAPIESEPDDTEREDDRWVGDNNSGDDERDDDTGWTSDDGWLDNKSDDEAESIDDWEDAGWGERDEPDRDDREDEESDRDDERGW
jgi:hypothetical protein